MLLTHAACRAVQQTTLNILIGTAGSSRSTGQRAHGGRHCMQQWQCQGLPRLVSGTPAIGCVGEHAVGAHIRARGRALVPQHAGRLLVVAQAPVPELPPADLEGHRLVRGFGGRGCLLLGGAGCESCRQEEQVQHTPSPPYGAARPCACHQHALRQQVVVNEHIAAMHELLRVMQPQPSVLLWSFDS